MRKLAIAALLCLAAKPAMAAAVTYTGTVGGKAVVVELTDFEDGPMVGRYSYLDNGADIPLHPLKADRDRAELAEELPCTPAICERPDGNHVLEPPLGGRFSLHFSADGKKLTGTWRVSASAKAALPVELDRFGERNFDRDPDFLYQSFVWTRYEGSPIAPDTSPYDFAKMQVTLTAGPVRALNGATFREMTDPRTRFALPRLVSLPGGDDIGPINAVLDQLHWAINFGGFECLGRDYLSQGWMAVPFGNATTSLGGIDKTRISIDYLSDTVMTVREAGRSECGGGAPFDFISYHTFDVRAGRVLAPGQIFKDWDAAENRPTMKLVEWVRAAYRKAPNYDPDHASGCATDDNMIDGLAVTYGKGDVATFLIDDIEDTGCIGPIVSVPLADMRELLTGKAVDYFPSLKP